MGGVPAAIGPAAERGENRGVAQDLTRIKAFLQVYEASGFSAAARQYGRSKALLSKYVTELEDHLGVRLMNRTTRKLSLTEAGEAYFREASSLVQQLEDLDATIADQSAAPRGLLRVSAPRNFGETRLAPAFFAFLQAHEGVSLDLRLEDRMVDLVDEGIDVALRISALPDSSLIARSIAPTQIWLCASPEFLNAHGTPRHPNDVKQMPCVIDTNIAQPGTWHFRDGEALIAVPVSGPVRVNSPVAALQAARHDMGLALLPSYLAAEDVTAGRLKVVLKSYCPEGPALSAVYPHRRHLPGKVRALIDHLVRWFEDHPISTLQEGG